MATQSTPFFTLEEYLEQERTALDRHEYLNGKIFAMAGGTPAHATITSNISGEFYNQLRKSGCTARNSDMMIRTSPTGLYSYADVVVSCENEQFEKNILLNPVVIVEVLSESTASYDRGVKFEMYRQIPSFREYLIVAQDRPYVEHHVRDQQDGKLWTLREYTDLNDAVTLKSIHAVLSLADIYARISFAVSSEKTRAAQNE